MHKVIATIRERLTPEKFEHFAQLLTNDCQRKGELKWWMDKLWQQLKADNPDFECEDLLEIGRTCPIHWGELIDDEVKIVYGTFAQDLEEFVMKKCPLHYVFAMGPCWGGDQKSMKVQYCEECRTAYRDKYGVGE